MADETHYAVRVRKTSRHTLDRGLDPLLEGSASAVEKMAGVEVEIPGPTPLTPGELFLLPHTLGKRPDRVAMVDNGDSGGIIFASPEDKAQWSDVQVAVRCTVGAETNMTIRLTMRPQ